jgi:hypothetical protein
LNPRTLRVLKVWSAPPQGDSVAGHVIWSTEEIALHTEFLTERKSHVFRFSQTELLIEDRIRIPVRALIDSASNPGPVVVMHGEVKTGVDKTALASAASQHDLQLNPWLLGGGD